MSERRVRRGPITGNVLADAGVMMCTSGLGVGLVFPFFAVALGVETATALRWPFVLASLAAGLAVGLVGVLVIRREIGRPLGDLAQSMQHVRDQLAVAQADGDAAVCTPEDCRIELHSGDALGRCAAAFNELLEELARTRTLDGRIRALSVEAAEHLEPGPIASIALDHLVVGGPFDAGAVLVVRHDGIEVLASDGIRDPELLVDHPMVLDAIGRGRSRRTDVDDGVTVDAALVSFRPRVVDVGVLTTHGAAFGAVVLASTTELDAHAEHLALMARATLSLSLRNALTHQEVEQLAAIDALTGLYNRRLGLQRLDEEYSRAQRARGPLSVLLFDIDHFKAVNDTHGHLIGDRVLRAVADAAQTIVREGDSLVRLGGEEFVIIAPGASRSDAATLGERVRRACADVRVQAGPVVLNVTVSIGIASLPDPAILEGADLVARADEAMYAAKRTGRDRVVVAGTGIAGSSALQPEVVQLAPA